MGWTVPAILPAQIERLQILIWMSALAGLLLLAAVVIALAGRWTRRAGTEGTSANDQLTHFRNLYNEGAISKEEYERIRIRLAGEFRQEIQIEPPAPPPPEQPPTTSPPP